jgi:hypothetical protein
MGSLGVGVYPEPQRVTAKLKAFLARSVIDVQLIQKTLNVNTTSMEQLTNIFFKNEIPIVRINDTFHQPEMATDFLESDLTKLDTLYQRGRQSFAKGKPGIPKMNDGEMIKKFGSLTENVIVWGSDAVLKEFGEFRVASLQTQTAGPLATLATLEDLMLAIRRDLGYRNSKIERGDLLRLFINDLEQHREALNLLKR